MNKLKSEVETIEKKIDVKSTSTENIAKFQWIGRWIETEQAKRLIKELLEVFETEIVKTKQKQIKVFQNFDVVKFLEENNVKYDEWLKEQFFKLIIELQKKVLNVE